MPKVRFAADALFRGKPLPNSEGSGAPRTASVLSGRYSLRISPSQRMYDSLLRLSPILTSLRMILYISPREAPGRYYLRNLSSLRPASFAVMVISLMVLPPVSRTTPRIVSREGFFLNIGKGTRILMFVQQEAVSLQTEGAVGILILYVYVVRRLK